MGKLFSSQESNTVNNSMPVQQTTDTKEMEAVKEFTMTAKQWQFEPGEVRVKQGDKVRLKITATDVAHGFALPDFNVKADLNPNVETVVEFTADKKGEFTFFCNVLCGTEHKDMKGKLIVE